MSNQCDPGLTTFQLLTWMLIFVISGVYGFVYWSDMPESFLCFAVGGLYAHGVYKELCRREH